MARTSSQQLHQVVSYNINDLVGPDCGAAIAGFDVARKQPYAAGFGLRLSAPKACSEDDGGFTDVVQVDNGLHAVIENWPSNPGNHKIGVWAEHLDSHYGWLYIGLEGDGSLEVQGFGPARRSGATCSLTVTPPQSTYIWRTGSATMRRGVSIAFHARYLNARYPELLRTCPQSLGEWLAGRETTLRDFSLPLQPVMTTTTAALLNLPLEGEFRHQFVCSTVEQLLCLALAALVEKEGGQGRPTRLSTRDKLTLSRIREALDKDLPHPPPTDELVRRFGINRNKLRFGFKALYGSTISDYLHHERMRRAYDFLRSGGRSVTDVAAAIGYGHLSNFTTAFKREFGRTPSQVAADHKQ